MQLKDIASRVGGKLRGSGEVEITGVALPQQGRSSDIVYIEKPKYLDAALASQAGAFLIDERFSLDGERPAVLSHEPRLSFIRLLQLFEPDQDRGEEGVHPTAVVGDARIDPSATIMAGCVVGDGAVIGARVLIHPLCSIGERVKIGADTTLHPGVVIGRDCEVGAECVLFPGAVLGADGFGYHDHEGVRYRIPHLGRVVLGDGVELGANTTIDRAVVGETFIGSETKIDNLVQIGHNCRIGSRCYLVAQVGVGGSTVLGRGVSLGGQAGVSDHLTLGDGAVVTGGSAVRQPVGPGEIVGGVPAMPIRQHTEIFNALPKLHDLLTHFDLLESPLPASERRPEPGRPSWETEVVNIIARSLRVAPEAIGPEMDLKEEFGADSLSVLNLVTEIESKFDISIPDQDVRRLRTMGGILSYLEGRLEPAEAT